jgi:predicted amidohydrolase YtcJ
MTADLILTNADVRTMDVARPRATALAVRDGRIMVVGDDAAVAAVSGPRTRRIDAGGRLVLPGFQDAHVHLLDGGTDMVSGAALWEVETVEALLDTLAAHAARWKGPLVIGNGWQPGLFGEHNLTAEVLDRAVPDRPCIVYDSSYHSACVNSAGLRAAGIEDATSDPETGHIVRDGAGRATGMLYEEAAILARDRLPPTDDATWIAGLRAGQAHANRHGITGILDPSVKDYHARTYAALAAEDALTVRVAGAATVLPDDTVGSALDRLVAWRGANPGPLFHVNAAKFFLDGVLENRTAALLAPYADPAGGNAPLMFAPDRIAALFAALDAARFQIHVHVIGDLAARAALDGLEAARSANGPWPALHQLAHLQMVDPADFVRIAALGAMANIQPLWARHDPVIPDEWIDMIGPDRLPHAYAFRRMIDAGAPLCLSSDFPVSTLNPFEIIETAVTRQPRRRDGDRPPFLPAERLTVAEAVVGYTCHAARACWRGDFTGRLLPGSSADLIVLDQDIFSCPAHQIGDTEVLLTLFRGQSVWRHDDFDRGDFA